MNRLAGDKRARVIAALVEGCSIRSTVCMTGVAKNTVTKLLVDIGAGCQVYHDRAVRGLTCKRLQCDEIWAFCYSKQKNVPAERQGEYGYGDVWTWTALDSNTKLIVSYWIGLRTPADAQEFMLDLARRIVNLAQLTTDGLGVYPDAVYEAFGTEVDYAQLVKSYSAERSDAACYSPPRCSGAKKRHVIGCPDPDHISTSHVERHNLTMRMSMRRFIRLTNVFSKKVQNLEAAVSLHSMYYNYCRKHQTLGTTPAMTAGLADHVWSIDELVGLLEAAEEST